MVRMKSMVGLFACGVLSLGVLVTSNLKADPSDPFDRTHRAKPKLSRASYELPNQISFKARVEPESAKPGQIVRLIVTGEPAKGYHTYPLTRRTAQQSLVKLAKMTLEESPGLAPLWPIQESNPHFILNKLNDIELEHDKPFTWTQEILILPDAKPGLVHFDIDIRLMVCSDVSCTDPGLLFPPFEATINVLPGNGGGLSKEHQERLRAKAPPIIIETPPADLVAKAKQIGKNSPGDSTGENSAPSPDGNAAQRNDLWGLLGAAFGGALLMLLTPCVFPMIPITVNFFIKQSEKEHHRPFLMAAIYSGTIIFLLTLVMMLLGKVVITLANNPLFNLALGGVLIFFAFSLFGMYEIELPSGLARFTSAREGQGGFLGTIFMALTFTITSFTCTGPFLGLMLAPVAGLQPPFHHMLLASLVYSTTFAGPFFLLALFPSALKKLPKSGGWMNVIKVTMGFLELGAALKFLANADIAFFPGNPRLFNYDTVLCAWIALSFACGLYLLGVYRLPHDDVGDHIGVPRMIFATIFFGLTIYMFPLLRGDKPAGMVGEGLVAFLPPSFQTRSGGGGPGNPGEEHLPWHLDYLDGWKDAVKENKLIFIDFTGVNCTNCRDNEQNVFPKKDVFAGLQQYVRVQLYTDIVPNTKLSAAEAKSQADRNAAWRDDIADPTNPSYIIFRPDPKEPFRDGKLNGEVLARRNGKIFDVSDFVAFLRAPLANQVALGNKND